MYGEKEVLEALHELVVITVNMKNALLNGHLNDFVIL